MSYPSSPNWQDAIWECLLCLVSDRKWKTGDSECWRYIYTMLRCDTYKLFFRCSISCLNVISPLKWYYIVQESVTLTKKTTRNTSISLLIFCLMVPDIFRQLVPVWKQFIWDREDIFVKVSFHKSFDECSTFPRSLSSALYIDIIAMRKQLSISRVKLCTFVQTHDFICGVLCRMNHGKINGTHIQMDYHIYIYISSI